MLVDIGMKKKIEELKAKQKQADDLLLLQGGATMKLDEMETIKVVGVYYTDYYNDKHNGKDMWVARDSEEILCKSFVECLQTLLKINKVKEVQVLASCSCSEHGFSKVIAYTVLMKVVDEEALKKSEELPNICERISKALTESLENGEGSV